LITAGRVRGAGALLGLDRRALAERFGLSLSTIQRMEAGDGVIRGNVDSPMKLRNLLAAYGIELISDSAPNVTGGRAVVFVP
jgi:hypothetical protein